MDDASFECFFQKLKVSLISLSFTFIVVVRKPRFFIRVAANAEGSIDVIYYKLEFVNKFTLT
jgi:hypothetical protein